MAISLDDIKKLSPQRKALLAGVVLVLVGYLYWSFFLSSSLETRGNLKTKSAELSQKVDEKQHIASQKQKYIKDIALLKQKFELAMAKLPEKKDMPFLLYEIALAGKNAGVDSILFEPVVEQPADAKAGDKKQGAAKGNEPKPAENKPADKPSGGKAAEPEKFYKEIPVKVGVVGRFHNVVLFFEKMAVMPRIVNIEGFVMEESKDAKGKGRILNTACVIKTYMFSEKKDEQAKKKI
ncbi:type IV pilus assembly protein PilO [Syntrophus gentianae]|uniref:Type IV pilus assembly protein PilO n=1 Tax=Syntrophus gentianae TaxID=43775 RepID=A0A1H7UEI4_9BACT|nr:type 4a pilus biogenesis protein PilO [Syntrophus gentianae]SEL95433.1 type IV pilus assembly protein PilO [Syntrophus gentianae]